jgi:iron complex outermembrane receptor protein
LHTVFEELTAPDSFRPLDPPRDLSGNRIPRAPKFTASLGANYVATLLDRSRLTLQVVHRYSDEFFFEIFNDPASRQRAYHQTDAVMTLGTTAEDLLFGGWELAGYVKNIENEAVLISAIPTISVFGIIGEYAAPRTFGFQLTKRFSS